MFLQRHKSRLITAAVFFAAFLLIGKAAQTADTSDTYITPEPAASAPVQEVKVSRTAIYASAERIEGVSETIPAITVEETEVIEPAEETPEAPAEPAEPVEDAAAPVPYLTYYEHGHFAPGENGVLITAEGEEVRYSSVIEVSATAYTTERQENKITATGTVAHVGGIAVDPKVIPYGTKMYIVSKAGAWAYGYAVAEDCGGGIKGNKIDLFFDTYDECIQFGVRNALVYILEE